MESLLQVAVRNKEVCCKSQLKLTSKRRCATKYHKETLLPLVQGQLPLNTDVHETERWTAIGRYRASRIAPLNVDVQQNPSYG
jgi:hypothetical protein